jgi:hypothetical protein
MVHGRQHRVKEKICQSKSLGSRPRDEERVIHQWSAAEMRDKGSAGAIEMEDRRYETATPVTLSLCIPIPTPRVSRRHSPSA